MIKRFAEHINENVNKFKIGNRVVCDSRHIGNFIMHEIISKHGKLLGTIINTDGKRLGVQFDRFIDGHDSSALGEPGKFGYCYNLWPKEIRLCTEEEEEGERERLRMADMLKLKHKDLDPYGEEEWEDD